MTVDLCCGDGGGPIITSSRDPLALVKVCGRFRDLIRYWYDGTCLIYDGIRDGDYLDAGDIKFPLAEDKSLLPIPPFAVRYGRERDLIRVYTAPRAGHSAKAVRYEPRCGLIAFHWLAIDRLQCDNQIFIYDSSRNAFLRDGVSLSQQDVRAVDGRGGW